MGSRLGVLIRDDEGWELYFDNWAAESIGLDMVLDGFEGTLARVRNMAPIR